MDGISGWWTPRHKAHGQDCQDIKGTETFLRQWWMRCWCQVCVCYLKQTNASKCFFLENLKCDRKRLTWMWGGLMKGALLQNHNQGWRLVHVSSAQQARFHTKVLKYVNLWVKNASMKHPRTTNKCDAWIEVVTVVTKTKTGICTSTTHTQPCWEKDHCPAYRQKHRKWWPLDLFFLLWDLSNNASRWRQQPHCCVELFMWNVFICFSTAWI